MKKVLLLSLPLFSCFYVFYDIDFKKLFASYKVFDSFGIFLALFVSFLSYVLQALRLSFLSKTNFKQSFEANFVCLALNNVLPFKAGEVAKCFYLNKIYNTAFKKITSATIIERVFDIYMVIFILLIISTYIKVPYLLALSLSILSFIVFYLLIQNIKQVIKLSKKFLYKKLAHFVNSCLINIAKINKKEWFIVFFYSILIWLAHYLIMYVFFSYATSFNLSFLQVLVFYFFFLIGYTIPSTPSGLGLVQAGGVFALLLFNIEKEEALALSIVIHFMLIISQSIIGLVILFKKGFSYK